MSNSKLIEITGALSKEEKAAFGLFLKSPFFVPEGISELMLRYFSYLCAWSTEASTNKVDKLRLHALLFPEKPYSESRLEKTTTRFGELMEQFLVTKQYGEAENAAQRALDLIRIFRTKGLNTLHERSMQKLKQELQSLAIESTAQYQFQYLLYREEHEWKSNFNVWKNDLSVPATIQQLDLFYFSERIELLNRLLLQQAVLIADKANVSVLGLDTPSYYATYEGQSPLLRIRMKIQQLFLNKHPTKQDFELLMQLLKAQEQHFPEETIQELTAFLRNICTMRINTIHGVEDKLAMFEILHQIHEDNLKKGYFYYNGMISPFAMMNITKVALKTQKWEWAKAFVDQHRKLVLSDDDSEEMYYHFCLALVLFTAHQFEESLEHLPLSTNIPYLLLESRRFELMNLYELRSDLLPYKIDAFRKYLERTVSKSMSSHEKESNLIFTKLLQQLVQSKPGDATRSAKLEQRILSKKVLADGLWLLEKVRFLAK